MLYGLDCQAINKTNENKLNVAAMSMLTWMYSKTKKNKIKK